MTLAALRRALCALLLLALLHPRPARAQSEPETLPAELVLGFSPTESAQALQRTGNELAALLTERIHVPVRAYVALDYTALVESMRAGQVQFAFLTPAPMVLAERMLGAQVILTQVHRGNPNYFGAIVVRDDSPVRSLEQLRGRTIAWVDPQSTSGYVIPRYLLASRGMEPEHFFRQQVFAGGHDSAVFAVQSGRVDAAAVWSDTPESGHGAWTRFLAGRPGPRLRPIFFTPPVPSDAVSVLPAFAREHPALLRSLRAALVSLGQSEQGRDVLHRLNGTDGFVDATPNQYELVRRAFAANRAATRNARFEHPVEMLVAALLLLGAVVLVLPFWKRARRARGRLGWLLFLSTFVWSAVAAELSLTRLLAGRASMTAFLRSMLPPDRSVLPAVLEATVTTLQLALVGTVLSVPLALAFGFLAAENVTPSRPVRGAVRLLLNLDRSVDTLILALILVSAVGLGPLAGVVALAVHGVGSLGKQFYETLETLDPGPPEAMRAVGATRLQVLRWGLWPQFAPHFVSAVLFRFELNVRVSTVLGLVGAGGIGFLLITYMRGAEYARVSVVVVAIVLLVMALDALSTRLRATVQ